MAVSEEEVGWGVEDSSGMMEGEGGEVIYSPCQLTRSL